MTTDPREHFGWGRITQDKQLIEALEKLGGKVIHPHRRSTGFVLQDDDPQSIPASDRVGEDY